MGFSFLTLNCCGLCDEQKRLGLLQWLRCLQSPVDFVCLQEKHRTSASEASLWYSSSGYSVASFPSSLRSCGCLVLYRPVFSLLSCRIDSDGRFLRCNCSFHDVRFSLVCVYAPNRNPARNDSMDDLPSYIDLSSPTVICGDFNTVLDRSLDRRGSIVFDSSRESKRALSALFVSCCVLDIWRYLHPQCMQFTWTKLDGSLSSRIDYIGCPYAWISSISSCDILSCPFSDHCAVIRSGFFPASIPQGPGIWKLNTSVLLLEDYGDLVYSFSRQWRSRKSSFASIMDWWELGKSKLKGLSISYCMKRVAAQRLERDLLSNLVSHLKTKIDEGCVSCVGPYHSALFALGKIDIAESEGARLHSRTQWIEDREVSSSFFFRLEKKNQADRWVAALKDADGSIRSDMDGLIRILSGFYSSLFSADETLPSAQDFLLTWSARLNRSRLSCVKVR